MNILMVGGGKGGSWQMRGVQLGAALGARVTTMPSDDDWRWADLAVLIKKAGAKFAPMAHRLDVPIIWDALDFWRQPADNSVTPEQAMALGQAMIASMRPSLVIGATQAMANVLGGVYLPHHSWVGLEPTPARETVTVVAYQGGVVYLGRWKSAIEKECARRGWTFVINPSDLSAVDIVVAFRDGPWDGWICRQWKSGIKLVNAIAAGRPIVTQDSAAFRELNPVGSRIESFEELSDAFDQWHFSERLRVVDTQMAIADSYRIEPIAERYRSMLASTQVAA